MGLFSDLSLLSYVYQLAQQLTFPECRAMSSPLLLEIEESLAIITLNNPARANVLDLPMAMAFAHAVGEIAANPKVRALLITANGKQFCAGGDITAMQDTTRSLHAVLEELIAPIHTAIAVLRESSFPIVSAVNGAVGGGGIGMALCADLVLAAESMKLRGGYSAIGLTPDAGGSWFVTQRAGAARAKEIYLTNRAISAAECLQLGLVDAVHPDAELAEAAKKLAVQLSRGPSLAQGRIKMLIREASHNTIEQHLEMEKSFMLASGESADGQEGVRAFTEKRAPKFL